MVVFEPEGSDAGDEVVWIYWESIHSQDCGLGSKKFGKRFSMINVQRTALDAALIRTKLRGGKA